MPDQMFICGQTGPLTDAAKQELEAFAAHLRNHPKHARQPSDCRFCAEAELLDVWREWRENRGALAASPSLTHQTNG